MEAGNKVHAGKSLGNWQVDKLQTILLEEADFNFLNKILGREALQQAERCNQVAPKQYGSHPGGQHHTI